jgi:hypothetical protein
MYRLSLHYADGQVEPESLILKLATVNAAQEYLHEVATFFREVNFYAGPAAMQESQKSTRPIGMSRYLRKK